MRRLSSFKRWAVKLGLCLLAGAVVTWMVAWGCVLSGLDARPRPFKLVQASDGSWTNWYVRGAWGYQQIIWGAIDEDRAEHFVQYPLDDFVVGRSAPMAIFGYGRRADAGATMAAGWPLAAFHWLLKERAWEVHWQGHAVALPLSVSWAGFALDTVLYATTSLCLFQCVGFARRRRRIAKGRCPSCGYDRGGLTGDAACPECGGKA